MCEGDDCEDVHTFATNKKSVSGGRLAYNGEWDEITEIQFCSFFPLGPMYVSNSNFERTIGCSRTLICPPRQCTCCADANAQWRCAT